MDEVLFELGWLQNLAETVCTKVMRFINNIMMLTVTHKTYTEQPRQTVWHTSNSRTNLSGVYVLSWLHDLQFLPLYKYPPSLKNSLIYLPTPSITSIFSIRIYWIEFSYYYVNLLLLNIYLVLKFYLIVLYFIFLVERNCYYQHY
jgi:hypothetical protein